MQKKLKAHHYLWITSAVIFILGLFTYSDNRALLDFNIFDSYYITHIFNVIASISLFYFLLGSIYLCFSKCNIKLNKILTKIHVLSSFGGFILYIFVMAIFEDDTQVEGTNLYNENSVLNVLLIIIIVGVIFSQVIFLVNLVQSIIKHGIQRSTSEED